MILKKMKINIFILFLQIFVYLKSYKDERKNEFNNIQQFIFIIHDASYCYNFFPLIILFI